MLSGDIQCAYCGSKGKIEGFELPSDERNMKIFKHRGNNPFSGHLHYQCPSCSIVLLVLPMDVLDGKSLTGVPHPAMQHDFTKKILPNTIETLARFGKTIQTCFVPSMQR